MTVSSNINKDLHSGDGATTVFPFTFPILDESHFIIQEIIVATGVTTSKTLTTHYSVSGTGNTTGQTDYISGNITMLVAPATGVTLVVKRNMPLQQGTRYPTNGPFPAAAHENAIDELTMNDQQQQEHLDRTISFDSSITGFTPTLPVPTVAAHLDGYLKLNAAGTAWEFNTLSTSSGLANVVDDTSPQYGANMDSNGYNLIFDDAKGVIDDSGNEVLNFQKSPSAVNYIVCKNNNTGNPPLLRATGDDANVDFRFESKGASGFLYIGTTLNAATLKLREKSGNGTNTISIKAPEAITTSGVLTLPEATDTLAGLAATQIITNKTIDADNNTITNIGASEVELGIIASQSVATPAASDNFLFGDVGDSSNLKRSTLQGILDLVPGVKTWFNYRHDTDTLNGSHNITSITDNSAGNFTATIANDYASTSVMAASTIMSTTVRGASDISAIAAGSVTYRTYDAAGTATDFATALGTITGDLA